MKRTLWAAAVLTVTVWLMAQPVPQAVSQPGVDPLMEGFRMVEVASVSDAMEQLYGQKGYMAHQMRPLTPTKFAGPAVTVLMKKEEHKEGSKASEGMLDAIDNAKPGSVPTDMRTMSSVAGASFGVSNPWASVILLLVYSGGV